MPIRLRSVNNVLLTVIILVNGYIITAPLLPQVSYWWRSHHGATKSHLLQLIKQPTGQAVTVQTQPNSLIIPAMLLNQSTLEGPESDSDNILRHGIWRWPGSSTPDKGGNTVFLSHRFSYTGPHGAFYYLDKLKVGDTIGVVWNGKTYTYRVNHTGIVAPTDTSIEANTSDARLTLFTCAPLWHPVNRLVVTASLETNS